MKRLIREVNLIFFQDDANGEYGLTHKETYDDNYGNGFNAFWDGIGIFHDVFEHSHEFTHKYFRGEAALNIGGEMTAMGAMWYYYDVIGVNNRQINPHSIHPMCESMKRTTLDEVQESIQEGYCRYGNVLECNVPKQIPTDNYELEYQIQDYWKKVRGFTKFSEYDQEKEAGKGYKKSVSFRKIADLHRYGYRMAKKLIPDNYENRNMMINFINYWNFFYKDNKAEEMQNYYNGITFKIYKENDIISWKGIFEAKPYSEVKNAVITENTNFNIKDYVYSDFVY